MKSCAATWKTMSAADKAKTKYTDYMGTCMKAPPAAGGCRSPGTGRQHGDDRQARGHRRQLP